MIYDEARRRRRSRLSGAAYVLKCCLMVGPIALVAFRLNDRIAEHRLFEAQAIVVLFACMVGFAALRLRGRIGIAAALGVILLGVVAGVSRDFANDFLPPGHSDAYPYWRESQTGDWLLAQGVACGLFVAFGPRRRGPLTVLGSLAISATSTGLYFLWSARSLLTIGHATWAEVCVVSPTGLHTNIFTTGALVRSAEWGAAASLFCAIYTLWSRRLPPITPTS
ncbi:MAG: hypothetical protein IT434_09140 [Phycisphaerales bacterium]|nr:hypothetical protein [Phycisphaerales bacterium]